MPTSNHCTPSASISAADEVEIGFSLARAGQFTAARSHYERALELEADNVSAHAALYEIAQVERDLPRALEHQRRMLARQKVFVEEAPRERRRLLVLLAPGDFQANVPIDFLIDRATTTLVKRWIVDPADIETAVLDRSDAVFTAIAQSDANLSRLHAAHALLRRMRLPIINHPKRVAETERVRVWEKLRELPSVVMPRTERIPRAVLEQNSAQIGYPLVLRPVDSQGGAGFARSANPEELQSYLTKVNAAAYYAMPFVDYRSPDGHYRKYRITLVDGQPFPFHLAISQHWMVHYYSSAMREQAWMRDEERRYLTQFESVFPPVLQEALRNIASAMALEYFSIDCAIDRSGRLVVFEADPAMIIHAMDRSGPFSYRLPHAQRIFAAFERLIDRARSG